jgi:hypothetical protein
MNRINRRFLLAALIAGAPLAACKAEPVVDSGLAVAGGTCDAEGGRMHWVIDSLLFGRVVDGVSDGFDLDDDVSTQGGAGGCGSEDAVDSAGVPGIDNAFGRIIPALESTEFVGAEPLINDTIRNGELLLMPQLSGVDDWVDDDCVGMAMVRGVGDIMVGTDGELLADQTLDLDTDFVPPTFTELSLSGGSVTGRPFDVVLPLQVLDATLEFKLREGAIRYDLQDDGHLVGAFSGGLETTELMEVVDRQNIDPVLVELLRGLLGAAADLAPDDAGECTQVSVVLEFSATPVHVYDDVWE